MNTAKAPAVNNSAREITAEDLLEQILANTDARPISAPPALNQAVTDAMVDLVNTVVANTDAARTAPADDRPALICKGGMDVMAALGMGAVATAPAPAPAPAPVTTPVPAIPVTRRAAGAAVGLPVTAKQWSYIRHLRGQCRKAGFRELAGREIANNRRQASQYISDMTTALRNRYQASPARRPGGTICSVCYTPGCTIGPMIGD